MRALRDALSATHYERRRREKTFLGDDECGVCVCVCDLLVVEGKLVFGLLFTPGSRT